eukprot:11217224-Lingulodinium_polyedra.AAC.1
MAIHNFLAGVYGYARAMFDSRGSIDPDTTASPEYLQPFVQGTARCTNCRSRPFMKGASRCTP